MYVFKQIKIIISEYAFIILKSFVIQICHVTPLAQCTNLERVSERKTQDELMG